MPFIEPNAYRYCEERNPQPWKWVWIIALVAGVVLLTLYVKLMMS